jgi:hypothetical protein
MSFSDSRDRGINYFFQFTIFELKEVVNSLANESKNGFAPSAPLTIRYNLAIFSF